MQGTVGCGCLAGVAIGVWWIVWLALVLLFGFIQLRIGFFNLNGLVLSLRPFTVPI